MNTILKNLIADKNAKVVELRNALIETEGKEERQAIGETLKALEKEIADLMAAAEEEPEAKSDAPAENRSLNVLAVTNATPVENAESRAKKFAENGTKTIETRSILVSSGHIATPTEVGGINDPQNVVSSIIDMVKITDAEGMGAYKVAYQSAYGAAGTQTEGSAYTAAEPTFGTVTISPSTKSILSYVSRQVQKQSPLNYEQKVTESALVSLRAAASDLVTDAIVASALNTTLTLATLDQNSLRQIALNYGGNSAVVGEAVLFLNKADLITLGDVRGTNDKKAVFEITPDASNPNVGIIKDGGLAVKYCINNDLTSKTLLYGQPKNCELALFSKYDIRVSEDYAFNTGLLAIRGDVELGADVVASGGFVKVTVTA